MSMRLASTSSTTMPASARRRLAGCAWPGSAALVVLSLGAVQSWTLGLLYIALFGAGSIAGMALLSLVIALPLQLTAARLARLHGGLTALLGLASCTLGVVTVARYAIAG
jgi:hypothetical protein